MRYFLGVILILIGLSLATQSSGLVDSRVANDAISAGLVVAIGVALFVWRRRYWPWAVILVIVGVTDFIENLQLPLFEEHTPWEYVWPAFLIVVGAWLMVRRGKASPPAPKG